MLPLQVFGVPGAGAEDVLVDAQGWVITGTEDGSVFRVQPDGAKIERLGQTGGRPLGLELLPDGRILVCDAKRGLIALDPTTGRVEDLVTQFRERPLRFCNNAAVASSGEIWFSDTSTRYGIDHWKSDMVEVTRTGRLFRRDVDGQVTQVLDGLHFANGVAVSADESFVVVAETGARTVVRHWLSGDRAGQRDYFAQDLPGYPDNVSRGTDGLIWVTIASPKDPVVERLQRAPLAVRRAVTRIPEALQPQPKRTVRVQAFNDAGVLIHDLSGDSTRFHMATGVREHDGKVWLGSLHEPAVAVMSLG